MHHFFLVIVLSFHVGYSLADTESSQKHRSHNLLKLEKSNNSVQRQVRCTPCEKDTNLRRPISNHLDPEYRGNGADNLGYDWSPMAWGGLAFPRRSKMYMGGMRGRDGRMMSGDEGRSQGNVQVICDTCRAYWDGDRRDGGSTGRGGDRGLEFDMGGRQNYYGAYWQGRNMRPPEDYETRVMSPTVGVLVKPGSRIAYIPSRSGEMYWDGVSGGGTRWDGFSNGISWIGGSSPDWDRSDSEPREPSSFRPGGNYPYLGTNAYRPWDSQKRPSNWADNSERDYYFTNGVPNDIDLSWKDRGYASNWHYGSTNQNGWNGNNMKWNYGTKQWSDNDRAANRFYFNSPQDRTSGTSDGHYQYGNQYPNYEAATRYPSWPKGEGGRPNDRFPGNFQQGSYGIRDKDRPWDYTSRDPLDYRPSGPRPEPGPRPGSGYPTSDNYGRFPGPYGGYDKLPSDKNDFEKPWSRPGYSPSKPGSSGNFPYGGNRYPEEGNAGGGRPNYLAGSGHLFFPNDANRQPTFSNAVSESEENRPSYLGGNRKPGQYPSAENPIGTFSGNNARPPTEYPGDKRPVIFTGGRPSGVETSTGGYPGGGGSLGGYPAGGSSSGKYPGGGTPPGRYPGGYPVGGSSSGKYPGGGTSPGGYPGGYPVGGSSSGKYPGGGTSPGGYPGGGGSSGGYPVGGSSAGGYPGSGTLPGAPGGYPIGGSSMGGYPGGGGLPMIQSGGSRPSGYPGPSSGYPSGGFSYPSGASRPGTYPSGSNYPESGNKFGSYTGDGSRMHIYYGGGDSSGRYPGGGSSRPANYPDESFSNTKYFGGSRPTGYPGPGRPGSYEGESNRPDGYRVSGNYPNRFPYPGGLGGSKNPPKGYYTGFITELGTDDGQSHYGGRYPNYFGSTYPGDKNAYPGKDRDKYFNSGSYSSGYPSGEKNRYPTYSEDRYSSGGSGGGSYPIGENAQGSDKFYYGQGEGKNKYPGDYPSNHRYPGGGGDEFDRNQGSSNDKNSWNYGQNGHRDGIYRRSGGSYPPYRGGQYYTSSYLAAMSTTAGSTQSGTEPKTQSATKTDEVTQPTSDSS